MEIARILEQCKELYTDDYKKTLEVYCEELLQKIDKKLDKEKQYLNTFKCLVRNGKDPVISLITINLNAKTNENYCTYYSKRIRSIANFFQYHEYAENEILDGISTQFKKHIFSSFISDNMTLILTTEQYFNLTRKNVSRIKIILVPKSFK